MSQNRVKLKKIWEDETLLELNMSITSPYCCTTIDFYTTIQDLKEFKDNLCLFSGLKQKSYRWVQGEDTEKAAQYVELNFFHFNNQGHIGIEFLCDNKLEMPYKARLNFYIITELNQIDDFIYKLEGLIKGTTDNIEGILDVQI